MEFQNTMYYSNLFSYIFRPENRPLRGICVANHTSPLDVVILSTDNCYAMVCIAGFHKPLFVHREEVIIARLLINMNWSAWDCKYVVEIADWSEFRKLIVKFTILGNIELCLQLTVLPENSKLIVLNYDIKVINVIGSPYVFCLLSCLWKVQDVYWLL